MPLGINRGPNDVPGGVPFGQGLQAGIQAGLQSREQDRLKEIADRQAVLQGVQTLGGILQLPPTLRGPMLDVFGERITAATGATIHPKLMEMMKKAGDEEAAVLRDVFHEAGLKLDPTA